MRRHYVAAVLVVLLASSRAARAEYDVAVGDVAPADALTNATTDTPLASAPSVPDPIEPPPLVSAPRFPRHFLFGNALALLLSSLSVGYEFLPAPHHSIGLNLHGQYGGGISSALAGIDGAFVGGGVELGYRFYGSRDGPFGPFFGLSFLTSAYHTQATLYRVDPDSFRYGQFGPAVDLGVSLHLDRTTVLALAVGAQQHTFVTVDPHELNDLTRLLVGDGLRPRGGIQVGKVF